MQGLFTQPGRKHQVRLSTKEEPVVEQEPASKKPGEQPAVNSDSKTHRKTPRKMATKTLSKKSE